MHYLTYLLHRWRFPEQVDYLKMGVGIEARHQRCAPYWRMHLAYSRAFALSALKSRRGGSLLVLGAGRLLDLDLQKMLQIFDSISLLDYDPSVLKFWKQKARSLGAEKRVHFIVKDVTGCLEPWTRTLQDAIRPQMPAGEVAELLYNLDFPELDIEKYDAVLSLNILSQLPLYFRDRVEALCKAASVVGAPSGFESAEVHSALQYLCGEIQKRHLELLHRSAMEDAVLIGDAQFFYYQIDKAHWQTEPALYFNEPLKLEHFELKLSDQWFWHIAPQGIEDADYGVLHDVRAYAWRRSSFHFVTRS